MKWKSSEAHALVAPSRLLILKPLARTRTLQGYRNWDMLTLALILLFGSCSVAMHPRRSDYGGEDVFYADAARSLVQNGSYRVNGSPETTQPPGLSLLLAVVFTVFGYSYPAAVIAQSVLATVGFMLAYTLIRKHATRPVAALICLLLISAPSYFAWTTRMVYPCFAYFFTTMAALTTAERYQWAPTSQLKIFWGGMLAATVLASLLIATGTIALLIGLFAVLFFSIVQDRKSVRKSFFQFVPIIVLGFAFQVWWMHQKPADREWPLPGYPASYLEQLKLKNGNYPELGMASLRDIPIRVAKNIATESDLLAMFALRHGLNEANLASVLIPILLGGIGWGNSVWRNKGTALLDWYFAGYQAIYLLWPWKMEVRFLLPIAPIACLYVWKGITVVLEAVEHHKKRAGLAALLLATLLTILAARWMYLYGTGTGTALKAGLVVFAWAAISTLAFFIFRGFEINLRAYFPKDPRCLPHVLWRRAFYLLVAGVIFAGIITEARIARENLATTDLSSAEKTDAVEILPEEIGAANWLRSNTAPDSRVMARHWPTIHHFSGRKLIWFPPISDPKVLLEGIERHKVDYVVVIRHTNPYYLPDDNYCFRPLYEIRPDIFRLVFAKNDLQIFRLIHRS